MDDEYKYKYHVDVITPEKSGNTMSTEVVDGSKKIKIDYYSDVTANRLGVELELKGGVNRTS